MKYCMEPKVKAENWLIMIMIIIFRRSVETWGYLLSLSPLWKTIRIVYFAVQADNREKIKDTGKRDKYLDLARESIKGIEHGGEDDSNCGECTWDNLQRIDKGRENVEIEQPIQTTILLRLSRILRRVLETWGDLLSLKIQWELISSCWGDNYTNCNWCVWNSN